MQEKNSTIVIESKTKLLDLRLGELLSYRDLILLFVKRNYSTRYKQMILGPAWLILSPLFTMIIYTIVFGGIAGLPTDGIPQPLFYLAGNIFWGFFQDCVNGTASTFTGNAGIFGKVYFPRLVTPISNILTSTIDFFIRLLMLLCFITYYYFHGYQAHVEYTVLLIPVLLLQVGLLGLGIGILISALTTKYKDLQVLVEFGMRIWMYITPVIYAMSMVPDKYLDLVMINPVTSSMLLFKDIFFSASVHVDGYWIFSWVVTICVLFLGIIIFNKVEKTFMDTI